MIIYVVGLPRSGKTTFACKLIKEALQQGRPVCANFNNTLCPVIDGNKLGMYTPVRGSLVLLDEAGIEFNSRKYKSFSDYLIKWFKLHGHAEYTVYVFSQSWDDIDVTIRRITDELWFMRRFPFVTVQRRIIKYMDIDSVTHQPIFGYKKSSILQQFLPFPFHRQNIKVCYRPKYYKYFNTHEFPDIPLFPQCKEFDYDYMLSPYTKLKRAVKSILSRLCSVFSKLPHRVRE